MRQQAREQHYRRPVGFFEAISASRRIKKYYDMVMIENFPYVHDSVERERLQSKYPHLFEDGNANTKHRAVSKEINKLTAIVHHNLLRINAPTWWRSDSEELEYDFEKHKNVKNKKTENFNVVLDRQYPVYRGKKGFNDTEVTYPMLEQSIAVYDSVRNNYWKKIINPLWWVAFILRLPISLMEHMGMNTETANINRFIYWLIQAIALLALSFVALKLGVEVDLSSLR